VIFTQALEMADVPVANRVIFSEGRTFEFAGAYFRNIVSEPGAHCILNSNLLDQQESPLSEERHGSEAGMACLIPRRLCCNVISSPAEHAGREILF
jgi:hypothetical protein